MEIRLKPWATTDFISLIKYAGNPSVTRNMSDGFVNLSKPEGAKKFIEFANSGTDKIYRAIELDGEVIGGIGISVQPDVYRKNAELGYWLAEPCWGRGVISKAIPMIVDEAFKTLDINRIFAKPFHTNLASHRVLEKSGFKLETILEKTVFKNGEYLDEYIYATRK
jgi:[ribosomal protein S5]-alanine N-acetyltransferase